MNKTTFISIILWMVFAIIFIAGQISGVKPFFVICNDIFAVFNGILIIGLIPQLYIEIRNRIREKKKTKE